MLQTTNRPAPRRGTDRFKSLQYSNNRHQQIIKIPRKSKREISLEAAIKEWCIDLLAESRFDGVVASRPGWESPPVSVS